VGNIKILAVVNLPVGVAYGLWY